jgi:hypothetical protein
MLQLCLRHHLNQRFAHKVMGLQSYKSPNFRNFKTPTWESQDKMTFGHKEYYKGGRWWLPSSLGHGESCEFVFARGSSMHRKCSNYALINLLFGLCKSIWIIDLLIIRLSPYPGILARPSIPEVLWAPNSLSFRCFHHWSHNWIYSWVCQLWSLGNNREKMKTISAACHHNLGTSNIKKKPRWWVTLVLLVWEVGALKKNIKTTKCNLLSWFTRLQQLKKPWQQAIACHCGS